MPLIADRRLQNCSDADLAREWEELAWLLQQKRDAATGRLPPLYAAMYRRLKREFDRRGVQLHLFD
jgi:hypothetical protein